MKANRSTIRFSLDDAGRPQIPKNAMSFCEYLPTVRKDLTGRSLSGIARGDSQPPYKKGVSSISCRPGQDMVPVRHEDKVATCSKIVFESQCENWTPLGRRSTDRGGSRECGPERVEFSASRAGNDGGLATQNPPRAALFSPADNSLVSLPPKFSRGRKNRGSAEQNSSYNLGRPLDNPGKTWYNFNRNLPRKRGNL